MLELLKRVRAADRQEALRAEFQEAKDVWVQEALEAQEDARRLERQSRWRKAMQQLELQQRMDEAARETETDLGL